jgi:hypothetical protein
MPWPVMWVSPFLACAMGVPTVTVVAAAINPVASNPPNVLIRTP